MADQKSVKDAQQLKLVEDAVKFCRELQRQYTGTVFAHKMRGYTYSSGDVSPMEKEGGTWRFEQKLVEVWDEFLVEIMGPEYGNDLTKKKEATALSYALLQSGIEPVVRKGLVVIGGTPSGSSQVGEEPAPTAPPPDGGGGGKEEISRGVAGGTDTR
jgi:hypothetical protein